MKFFLKKPLINVSNFSPPFLTSRLGNIRFNSSVNKNNNINPVLVYSDADLLKKEILWDNIGKAGIYRFTNKVNGKFYIGSSCDLGRRFQEYFRPSVLSRGMLIYKAISKYGISNFEFSILEYTEQDNIEVIEQTYIDALKPEYNLSRPSQGSNYGYKWSEDQIAKKKEYYKSEAGLSHISKVFRKDGKWSDRRRDSCPVSIELKVTEVSTGIVTSYASIRLAAAALGVTQQALSKRLKTKNSFTLKGLYLIEKMA